MAILCLLVQTGSATFQTRDVESPNAAAAIARTLAHDGEFVFRPSGSHAFHLPGEPLYLAAAFRLLPENAWPYLHVPVTVLLVTSVAAAAWIVDGPLLAVVAGTVITLEPFIVSHGPVWDDTFLAEALQWPVFLILLWKLSGRDDCARSGPKFLWVVVAACTAAAAVTRLQSQLVLASVAGTAIALKMLQPIRSLAWTILLALTVALCAWGVRNAAVLGHFFIGSSHDGKTFEESTGLRTRDVIIRAGQAGGSSTSIADAADEVEADRRFKTLAWRYIAGHPEEFIQTAALKAGTTLLGIDLGRPVVSSRNLVGLGTSLILLTAGPFGLWSLSRHLPTPVSTLFTLLVTITTIVTIVLLTIGPVGLRYRLGLSTFLCLGTGAAVLRAANWASRVRRTAAS